MLLLIIKKIINGIFVYLLTILHKIDRPFYKGDYFVIPKPPYLSQFVSILPSSIKVDELLTNKSDIKKYGAKNIEEFSFWAWRNCGITCVKMILDARGKAKNKSIMELTKEGIELGGYVTHANGKFIDKGWFHYPLAALLNKHGVKTTVKKWQSLESIVKDILKNKLVIISVILPGRSYINEDGSFKPKKHAKYGGHLLLATGVKMDGKEIKGIYAHDPRGLKNYQKDTLVPSHVLRKVFSNRTIVA